MKEGGDFFGRTRREWLKRALLAGAAMPLLLREALVGRVPPFVGFGQEYGNPK
jgi:hypothetical protein